MIINDSAAWMAAARDIFNHEPQAAGNILSGRVRVRPELLRHLERLRSEWDAAQERRRAQERAEDAA